MTVHPEPVEGSARVNHGFDKLSPNGNRIGSRDETKRNRGIVASRALDSAALHRGYDMAPRNLINQWEVETMISPNRLTVTDADLEIFFECEPSKIDRDVPWPYNEFTFAYERGAESIEFKIHPAEPSVEIKVTRSKQTTYELKAFGIVDVIYRNDNGQESLELTLSQHHQIFLRLKPNVVVYEAFSTFV